MRGHYKDCAVKCDFSGLLCSYQTTRRHISQGSDFLVPPRLYFMEDLTYSHAQSFVTR